MIQSATLMMKKTMMKHWKRQKLAPSPKKKQGKHVHNKKTISELKKRLLVLFPFWMIPIPPKIVLLPPPSELKLLHLSKWSAIALWFCRVVHVLLFNWTVMHCVLSKCPRISCCHNVLGSAMIFWCNNVLGLCVVTMSSHMSSFTKKHTPA